MKEIRTALYFLILFALMLPDLKLSAGNNQLITELIVTDNHSIYRYLYLYDNNGNKVVETKSIKKNNQWLRISQTEWFYEGVKCVLQRENIWVNTKWEINYDIDYQYINGKIATELHQTYANKIASPVKKIDFSYTSNILALKKEYKRMEDQWILTSQTNFTYTLSGKSDSVTTLVILEGAVNNQYLFVKTYYENGAIENLITKIKNGTNEWINSELVNYYYPLGSSNLYSQRTKKWNNEYSNWENVQRVDYQYDNSNRIISETYQRWKMMFWDIDIRYDYIYENNNLVKKALSLPIYHKWRNIISINYSDFNENNANLIESQFDFWGGITGDYTSSFIPFVFNGELEIRKGQSIKLNYLPVVDTYSATIEFLNLKRKFPVYPNPSNGVYYLNTQDFKIISWTVMDLNGRILKNQDVSFKSGIIDITDLSKGIYVLSVNCENQQIIQKLIKE
ncbi:MAG: T9SS type A sorting domain-containing protein [Paludibacter sp.]|nr:T9SS type A sorting domain-containing protein [Paludibacter sp.]